MKIRPRAAFKLLDLDDPGIVADIDNPDDYRALTRDATEAGR